MSLSFVHYHHVGNVLDDLNHVGSVDDLNHVGSVDDVDDVDYVDYYAYFAYGRHDDDERGHYVGRTDDHTADRVTPRRSGDRRWRIGALRCFLDRKSVG